MGLPILAIAFTRSPLLVAGLEAARMVPWLIGALPVGAITDRIDRRKSMVWSNTARALLIGVCGIVLAAANGSIWLLYGAAVAIGVAEVFYDTAAQTVLPAVVDKGQLDRANGRLFAVELGAQEFIGPPLAGALVTVSASIVFFSSGAMWVAAIAALLLMAGSFTPDRQDPSGGSLWNEIKAGLTFISHNTALRTLALMSAMATIALGAAFSVLVLFVVGPESPMDLTPTHFGLLFAAMAAGGLIGALMAEPLQRLIGRSRALTLGVVGLIVTMSAPAITTDFWLIAVALFLGGFGNMVWNVVAVSYRQRATPDALLGRVNSSYRLIVWGARPIGALIGGAIAALVSVEAVYALMALLAAAILIPNRTLTDETLAASQRD